MHFEQQEYDLFSNCSRDKIFLPSSTALKLRALYKNNQKKQFTVNKAKS